MNIKKEIKLAFIENKKAICISFAILFISLILGYVLEPYLHSLLNPVVDNLTEKVKSGVVKLTFADIFSNNLRVIVMMFLFGILFCFCALILAFNGFFVGYYVATAHNLLAVLLLIVPHSLFELPSCAIACASGFVLFHSVCKFVKALFNQKGKSFLEKISGAFDESYVKLKQAIILFMVAVVLMVIAGIFEVYFTKPIAEFVLFYLR